MPTPQTPDHRRLAVAVVAAVAAVAAIVVAVTSSGRFANADDSDQIMADELYSVTVTVTNNSSSPLTLETATLGHDNGTDGGHWQQRPTDLAANGGTTTASAYAAVQGQAIQLVYLGGAGKVTLVAQDPAIGSNNTNGTKSSSGITVNASIGSGRDAEATFAISD